jgi:hypothetical protein
MYDDVVRREPTKALPLTEHAHKECNLQISCRPITIITFFRILPLIHPPSFCFTMVAMCSSSFFLSLWYRHAAGGTTTAFQQYQRVSVACSIDSIGTHPVETFLCFPTTEIQNKYGKCTEILPSYTAMTNNDDYHGTL